MSERSAYGPHSPLPSYAEPDARFPRDASAPFALEALPAMLDIGEAMLLSGADVHSIEEELMRLGHAYGARKMNVMVITATIIATMTLPGGYEHTLTRRITGDVGIDFHKMERLFDLCAKVRAEQPGPDEVRRDLHAICARPIPAWALFAGGMLSAGAVALFFGGTLLDAAVSAAFAILLCCSIRWARPWTPDTIIFNFVNSFICGLGIMAVAGIWTDISPDLVMIGDIMLLIPGVAMTNATRDMLSGDTISGVMRFVESLLWAVALALGFMAAIWIAQVTA